MAVMEATGNSDQPLCLHCQEPIRPGARRCPSCLSWQSRWAGDSQNPRLEIVLGLVAAVVAVALFLGWAVTKDAPDSESDAVTVELEVVSADLRLPVDADRGFIAVVGEVVNRGEVGRKNVYFQVECFDAQDRRIDAFATRSYPLVVLPGERSRFKLVESHPLAEPDSYARCSVEVRWADVIK